MTWMSGNGPIKGAILSYHLLSGSAIIVILFGSVDAASLAQYKVCWAAFMS
jgi:hypothetical protein